MIIIIEIWKMMGCLDGMIKVGSDDGNSNDYYGNNNRD